MREEKSAGKLGSRRIYQRADVEDGYGGVSVNGSGVSAVVVW